jgi:hypothetical protein
MTKNGKPYEMKLTVALDRRDKFSEADRKAQYDAAQKVKALFGDESALMDRILALRASLATSQQALASDQASGKAVSDFDGKVDAVRKQIVATTEGGAITGEERLREHTDHLYGAILSYEGKPADYQMASIDALKRELADASNEFEQLIDKELPALNETLKAKGQQPIPPPPATTPKSRAAAIPCRSSRRGLAGRSRDGGMRTLPYVRATIARTSARRAPR